MIMAALGLRAPVYGHVSLLVGKDGAPLSKRHGDPSVAYYRERGYAPEAIANHLFPARSFHVGARFSDAG